MRKNLAIIILLILHFDATSQNASSFPILYVYKGIQTETSNDFIYLLNKGTGENWQLKLYQKVNGPGIFLNLNYITAFKTKESFSIQSNGKDQLIISSASIDGLVFGFYKLLRNLGYKFYLPDELYTIIPRPVNLFGSKKYFVDQPFLQIRDFFGTGGFGSSEPDADRKVEKEWNRWRLRNGFGAAFQLAGHRGENFILDNYDLLQSNPKWLAEPLSGNKQKDQLIKLNYQNQEALDFYINWSIKQINSNEYTPPLPNISYFLSMEPSDGGGFINELSVNGIKKLPSISDQVYHAANLAAQALEKKFPDHPNIGVNLYAYSSHAAPPSFKLHPRVFVQLIPYQFQNIAFGPSFIKLWKPKLSRFGLYDYLNYTDSQYDLPGGITIGEAMKRLIHSVRMGSEGTTYESSYSKFATGIPLWVLVRYMADGNADWEKNLTDATSELYGKSYIKIIELFKIFYSQSEFGNKQLANAAKILNDASILSTDTLVQQRLNELKIYLNYADLVLSSRNTSNGSLSDRLLPLISFTWKIFPTRIIHSYRIMQLVSYSFLNNMVTSHEHAYYLKLHKDWFPDTERSKSAWNKIPQEMPVNMINIDFQRILQVHKPTITSQYKVADLLPHMDSQGLKPKTHLVAGGSFLVRGFFGVYTQRTTTISIKYKIDGIQPKLTISSIDKNYLHDTAILINDNSGSIQLRLPAGETTFFLNAGTDCTYRFEASLKDGLYFFEGSPRGRMAFYKNLNDPYENYSYGNTVYPSYIFMPNFVSIINYRVQSNQLRITSPSQRKINSELTGKDRDFELRKFTVQPNETGKFWTAEVSGNFNYQFLDMPDLYFLLEKK